MSQLFRLPLLSLLVAIAEPQRKTRQSDAGERDDRKCDGKRNGDVHLASFSSFLTDSSAKAAHCKIAQIMALPTTTQAADSGAFMPPAAAATAMPQDARRNSFANDSAALGLK